MTDGQAPLPAVTVIVTVPNGTARPDPLAAAIEAHHPAWEVVPVWAGDPQLRPPSGRAWAPRTHTERELAQVEPDARPLFVALGAVADRDRAAIVLTAGAVAVLGAVDPIVPRPGRLMTVPRMLRAPDVDHRFPHLNELAEVGSVSSAVLGIGAGAGAVASWLRAQLLSADPVELGTLLDVAVRTFPADRCDDPAVGVSAWRWDTDAPVLIEAPRYDPARPWVLDPGLDGRPRVSVAEPGRRAVLDVAAVQLDGRVETLCLPGGIPVDDVVRKLLRDEPDGVLRPWTDAAAFRRFVGARYWEVLWELEDDLCVEFPAPFGADAAGYAAWTRHAAFDDRAPLLVDPSTADAPGRVVRTADRTDGVNLIGYFRHQSGIANIARTVADVLARHGVPHTIVSYERTHGPLLPAPPRLDQRLEFANSLVFVNGDQFATFHRDHPEVSGPGRRVAGVWFWELQTLAGAAPVGDRYLDEIWAATTFMAHAFEELGSVPVHVVPIPFPPPEPSDLTREEFEPIARTGDRFVFGVVLDHMSVTARKNPIGAITAFRRAFRPGEGPVLVVKTINADRCWREHEHLLAAAADREDVIVWDAHLSRADHDAFIRSLDALVSLHRSEGLGLHLAEAMWMEVPVIATRYSGNLDFMDDDSALLVDARLVPVGTDGAWAYPASASWAEPDLDQAADAMRRLASDPSLARQLAMAGRARIEAAPGEAAFVARLRELLEL